MSAIINEMDANDMVCCPYNKAHRMLRKKLQQHIMKCREFYKDEVELLVCPFNKAHLIPETDYVQHTKSCIDRKIITHYQQSAPAVPTDETKHAIIESEENWDEDGDVPDYNPQVYAASANIVREPTGMFPSQRKEFIKQEQKRQLGIDTEEKALENKSTSSERPAPYKIPKRKQN